MSTVFLHGTVHEARDDLQGALKADPEILELWQNLTPLGRNEFICWVDDAKQTTTRQRRVQRTRDELLEGKKRPAASQAASTALIRRRALGNRRS